MLQARRQTWNATACVAVLVALVGLAALVQALPAGGDEWLHGSPKHAAGTGFAWQDDAFNGWSPDTSIGSVRSANEGMTAESGSPEPFPTHPPEYTYSSPQWNDYQPNSLSNEPYYSAHAGQTPSQTPHFGVAAPAHGQTFHEAGAMAGVRRPVPNSAAWTRTEGVAFPVGATMPAPAILESGVLDPAPALRAGGRSGSGARPFNEWEDAMRALLQNSRLYFRGGAPQRPVTGPVYITEDVLDPNDHHTVDMPARSSGERRLYGIGHFTRQLRNVQRESMANMDLGQPRDRIYVYFSSRAHLARLNEAYFVGKMHFLPINSAALTWSVANRLFTHHDRMLVLPPMNAAAMPVLMVRHEANTDKMRMIETLTGGLANQNQIVSLWSPMIQEDGRRTIVMYGIGQLDVSSDIAAVLANLLSLRETWKQVPYGATLDLEKALPRG